MDDGTGMHVTVPGLTSQDGMLIDTKNGDDLTTVVKVDSSVLSISAVAENGVYTYNGADISSKYAVGDIVTIANCTEFKNNGQFKINKISITTNSTGNITLVSKYDNTKITTGTSSDGCTMSKFDTDVPMIKLL